MSNHREHDEQVALFRWSAMVSESQYPGLDLMYAIPNAARRSPRQGAWMKAEGMKPGMPDVHLPVRCGDKAGLWIEMKADKNKPTENQKNRMTKLTKAGHVCVVCYSWQEAVAAIDRYYALEVWK